MNVVKRRMAVVLVLLAGLATAGASAQAAEAKRVGILKFRGPAEGASRNAVGRAVKAKKYQIVGAQQIDATAKKLRVKLNGDDGFNAVARELGIAAFVVGEVTKKKATLTIRDGSDGAVAAEATWSGANPRKLAGSVEKTFWKRLGSAIEHAKAPSGAKAAAVTEEAPAAESPAETESASAGGENAAKSSATAAADDDEGKDRRKKSAKAESSSEQAADAETTVAAKASSSGGPGAEPGSEGLDVAVALGALSRSLSYHQNPQNEPKYGLPLGPEVGVAADVFPAILLGSDGFATRLGLTLAGSALVPGTVSTKPPSGPGSYSTRSVSWDVGVKVRVPAGLFVAAGYGDRAFGLNSTGGATPSLVPTTNYRYVRVGLGARWRLGPDFSLMVKLAYVRPLSFGAIADANHYPKISGAAFDTGVTAGYRIGRRLEARLGAEVERFGLAFNVPFPANPPARIVGGAYDQYVSLWLGAAYLFGGADDHAGAASVAAPSSDEEKEEK